MTVPGPAQDKTAMKTRLPRLFAWVVLGGIVLPGGGPVRAASGPELFAKHCASCHGKDGNAQSPAARKLGVKDLTQSKTSEAEIEKQITEGWKDDRGNLKMPPFKDKLSAPEIGSLVVVVKGLRK